MSDKSNIILEFETVKYLGVLINNKATFDEHLEKLEWIFRTFRSRQKGFVHPAKPGVLSSVKSKLLD